MPETSVIQQNSIGAALNRSARKYSHQLALVFGERQWRYQALNQAANRVANGLLAAGLSPGDRLAVYGKNSDTYVIAWLAAAKAGLVHVPINFALSSDELRYILDQSGTTGLLSDISLADKVSVATEGLDLALMGTLHADQGQDAASFDVLAHATSGSNSEEPNVAVDGASLAQLLALPLSTNARLSDASAVARCACLFARGAASRAVLKRHS